MKELYEDAAEIIVSFYGLAQFEEHDGLAIDQLIEKHPRTKFYFTNLNNIALVQAKNLWPEVEILT
jgi:hypothetical protein